MMKYIFDNKLTITPLFIVGLFMCSTILCSMNVVAGFSEQTRDCSFENPFDSDGWNVAWCVGGATYERSTAMTHQGSYSLHLNAGGGGDRNVGISQTIECSGTDRVVKISGWRYLVAAGVGLNCAKYWIEAKDSNYNVKVAAAYWDGYFSIDYSNRYEGGVYYLKYELQNRMTTGQWLHSDIYISQDLDTYAGAGTWASLGICYITVTCCCWSLGTNCEIYFDEVYVQESEETTQEITLESRHNYSPSYDRTWTLTRTNAYKIRVNFAFVQTEFGDDWVFVIDENNVIRNDISGYYSGWSNWVTGDEIRIRLTSDSDYTVNLGFRIDKIQWLTFSGLSCEHPIGNSFDWTWTVGAGGYEGPTHYGAAYSRVHFEKIDTQADHDFVIIKDSTNTEITRYSNVYTDIWTPFVEGYIVNVRLLTDESTASWGFAIDKIECILNDDDDEMEITTYGIGYYWWIDPNMDNGDADQISYESETMGLRVRGNYREDQVTDANIAQNGDDGDLVYLTGHGVQGKYQYWDYLSGLNETQFFFYYDIDKYDMGQTDCEWIIFACSYFMDDNTYNYDILHENLHGIFGYRTASNDYTDTIVAAYFMDYCEDGYSIRSAFYMATVDARESGKVSSFEHDSTVGDHLHGYGIVFDDPTTNGDIYRHDWP